MSEALHLSSSLSVPFPSSSFPSPLPSLPFSSSSSSHPPSLSPFLPLPQPFIGVAESKSALLYCFTSPVGPYFKSGTFNPVSLYADPKFIRAWPGGVGESKMGGSVVV